MENEFLTNSLVWESEIVLGNKSPEIHRTLIVRFFESHTIVIRLFKISTHALDFELWTLDLILYIFLVTEFLFHYNLFNKRNSFPL